MTWWHANISRKQCSTTRLRTGLYAACRLLILMNGAASFGTVGMCQNPAPMNGRKKLLSSMTKIILLQWCWARYFCMKAAYDTAEYYFRKSLLLNPNDPDTLMPDSALFLSLGLAKRSFRDLYEKAIQLNPFNAGTNFHAVWCYSFLLNLEIMKKPHRCIVKPENMKDCGCRCLFCSYLLLPRNSTIKCRLHWNIFLDTYRKLISKGKDFTPGKRLTG